MKKYQVIGGQYESHWYGESDSLHGAKLIASKHREYWDNWQGWHTPNIYLSADVAETHRDGELIRYRTSGAYARYDEQRKHWLVLCF